MILFLRLKIKISMKKNNSPSLRLWKDARYLAIIKLSKRRDGVPYLYIAGGWLPANMIFVLKG